MENEMITNHNTLIENIKHIYEEEKEYWLNKSDLDTYYNIGKLLDADKHYGERIKSMNSYLNLQKRNYKTKRYK